MKKVIVGIVAALGLVLIQPTAVAANESIVIIDTAIDSTRPEFKDKLIYEACFVSTSGKCPNGKISQEGPGSATLPTNIALSPGFQHGTLMTLVANQVNPNVNIVFIRVVGTMRNGKPASFSDDQVKIALDWVIANKTKFNIVSVSASVGTHNKIGNSFCPTVPKQALISNIDKLIGMGVATMFASGNNGDTTRIDFPACLPSAIAVSASDNNVDDGDFIGVMSNSSADTDFYALGKYNVLGSRVNGTSASAAALSAYWAKNYKGTYQSTYDYFVSVSKSAVGRSTTTNRLVSLLG